MLFTLYGCKFPTDRIELCHNFDTIPFVLLLVCRYICGMKRLCYISRNYKNRDGAGFKAKSDNDITLRQIGATNLGLPTTFYRNKLKGFFRDLAGIIRYAFKVQPGDQILLQYPIKKYFSLICRIAHFRRAHVIALIHDLGSMRRRKLSLEQEIRRLQCADHIIASNDVMAEYLIQNNIDRPVTSLGIWDYRSEKTNKSQTIFDKNNIRVVYAGSLNLRKNSFLLKLPHTSINYTLSLYGNIEQFPQIIDNPNIDVHSFTPADEFIENVEGNFGLVWDGDSIDCCSGNFGEYLRYNSPHKVSFYLRAGLPIIIWKRAALASLLESFGVAITIDSLTDLPDALDKITPEQYTSMKSYAVDLAEKLQAGHNARSAVEKALKYTEI